MGTDEKMTLTKLEFIEHADLEAEIVLALPKRGPSVNWEGLRGVCELFDADRAVYTTQYRVAVVTTLEVEFSQILRQASAYEPAGKFLLRDHNEYYLAYFPASGGRLVEHEVVVIRLQQPGITSATAATTSLLIAFPNVHDVLVAGIACGIPDPQRPERDVRLGDIVVGRGGVIQHDDISDKGEQVIYRGQTLLPSLEMIAASEELEERANASQPSWVDYIAEGIQAGIEWPGHPSRTFAIPVVHYGMIGSGSTLLRNANHRNKLRDDLDVQAVEMEGAGVAAAAKNVADADAFVIRGVSDYGDDEKSDTWHPCAALGAACYVRSLLEAFPLARV